MTSSVPEHKPHSSLCEARVTLREINGDPLQPVWIETTVRGDTPDDIWKQVHEFQENGYAVWGLEGVNNR